MSNRETIEISYGKRGVVQAYHPRSGIKQLGETPAEAVDELWAMLEKTGALDD